VLLHLVQGFLAFGRIGGIDVKKRGVSARGFDSLDNLIHVSHGGATIEVDPEDIQACARQLAAGCLPETA
jgi:hypothetical protein